MKYSDKYSHLKVLGTHWCADHLNGLYRETCLTTKRIGKVIDDWIKEVETES